MLLNWENDFICPSFLTDTQDIHNPVSHNRKKYQTIIYSSHSSDSDSLDERKTNNESKENAFLCIPTITIAILAGMVDSPNGFSTIDYIFFLREIESTEIIVAKHTQFAYRHIVHET